MDDLAELTTTQVSFRPPPKRLGDGEQGLPEFLLVGGAGVLSQEPLDVFRHVSHTLLAFYKPAGARRPTTGA